MADDLIDPRETPLHPRFRDKVLGHDETITPFLRGLEANKLHHAWMLCGAEGIGKASLAYQLAARVLAHSNAEQTKRWIHARSHPDLFVLERQLADRKPVRIKSEISVEDARKLTDFFSHTSGGGGWRVGLIDAADDLSTESANAILKLVEEPPTKCLILLVCHQPGRVLRTLRSRCSKLMLSGLEQSQLQRAISALPISDAEQLEALANSKLSNGSPGRALQLSQSSAAKVFKIVEPLKRITPEQRLQIVNAFGPRGPSADDFLAFSALLGDWVHRRGVSPGLGEAYAQTATDVRIADGFNLDRRQSLLQILRRVDDALKAA